MSDQLNRRQILTGAAGASATVAIPNFADAGATQPELSLSQLQYARMMSVICQLERTKSWETYSTIAALRFAAQLIREALDLDLPFDDYAQVHVQLQTRARQVYEASD